MTLRLYDTGTRSVRDFVPLEDGKVSIYSAVPPCRPPPHVGHLRSGVDFDILRAG